MEIKKLKIGNKNLLKSKRAQLKTQEMAFMLMAVVLFFIIAGLFFLTVMYKDMYSSANLAEKEKTITTMTKLSDTAEFNCGKPLCVDTDKLMAMKNRRVYEGFWQVTSLEVVKIKEASEEEVECNVNNYPNCNLFKIYDKNVQGDKFSTFVALCRKEKTETGYWYDKCELGKVVAGMEVKQAGE